MHGLFFSLLHYDCSSNSTADLIGQLLTFACATRVAGSAFEEVGRAGARADAFLYCRSTWLRTCRKGDRSDSERKDGLARRVQEPCLGELFEYRTGRQTSLIQLIFFSIPDSVAKSSGCRRRRGPRSRPWNKSRSWKPSLSRATRAERLLQRLFLRMMT